MLKALQLRAIMLPCFRSCLGWIASCCGDTFPPGQWRLVITGKGPTTFSPYDSKNGNIRFKKLSFEKMDSNSIIWFRINSWKLFKNGESARNWTSLVSLSAVYHQIQQECPVNVHASNLVEIQCKPHMVRAAREHFPK